VNGLLDIMRGISTIASVLIVGRALSNGMEELFRLERDRCNGVGKVICSKCDGTKTLARRPAQKVPNLETFNRRQEDLYTCFVCGVTTLHDNFGPSCEEEDMNEAERIRDTIRNAIHNNQTPRSTPLAGTTLCPTCHGRCFLWHVLPNVPKLFGLVELWYSKPLRKGVGTYVPPGWTPQHSNYMEWPGRPLRPISEREVGYFGDDVFDYDDKISDQTWKLIEEDFQRKRGNSSGAQKEPAEDLEDFRFTTVQDISGI